MSQFHYEVLAVGGLVALVIYSVSWVVGGIIMRGEE